MGILSSGKSSKPDKVTTKDKGSKTETREYKDGKTTRIFETEKKTGKTTDFNIGSGGSMGLFGAFKGSKKK
jgi:hypothetical protein